MVPGTKLMSRLSLWGAFHDPCFKGSTCRVRFRSRLSLVGVLLMPFKTGDVVWVSGSQCVIERQVLRNRPAYRVRESGHASRVVDGCWISVRPPRGKAPQPFQGVAGGQGGGNELPLSPERRVAAKRQSVIEGETPNPFSFF